MMPGRSSLAVSSKPAARTLSQWIADANAAWSVSDHLNTSYGGSAFRVRRIGDNAEQDIGFASGLVDTAALLAFCGVNSGVITTLYDQSGHGRHLTQSSGALQPRIVSAGVLEAGSSGVPALRFTAVSSQFLVRSDSCGLSGNQAFAIAVLCQVLNEGSQCIFGTGGGDSELLRMAHFTQSGDRRLLGPTGEQVNYSVSTAGVMAGDIVQHARNAPVASSQLYVNGVVAGIGGTVGTGVFAMSTDRTRMGARAASTVPPGSQYYNGKITTVVLWGTVLTEPARSAIQGYLASKV